MKMPSREREQSRNILFIFSFCTIALATGLVYGWPALRHNLVTNEGSTLTENQLGIVFTLGAWSTHGGRFFVGIVRDRYLGIRATTCICLSATAAGCIGLAFCSKNNMAALTISFFLVGLGSGAMLCLQPVAGLFPVEYQGSVLASFSGSFQLAGLVFVALTSITEDRRKSFGPFALCLGLLVLLAYQLLPRNNFIFGDEGYEENRSLTKNNNEQEVAEKDHNEDSTCGISLVNRGDDDEDEQNRTTTNDNLQEVIEKQDLNEDTCGVSLLNENPRNNQAKEEEGNSFDNKAENINVAEKNQNDDSSSNCLENRGDDDEENQKMTDDNDFQKVIEKQDQNENTCDIYLVNQNKYGDSDNTKHTRSVSDESEKSSESIPASIVMNQIRSAEYILLVSWYSIQLIPLQYYVATIGFQLERKGDDDGKYTRLFPVLYASTAILAPVLGKIADMLGLGPAQAIGTILSSFSLFFLTLDAIPLEAHVAGMLCYGVGRLMVIGMFFTNIGKRFGYGNYGTLAGLGLLLSATACLLQYPMISLAAGGSESIVNSLSALLMVGIGLPYNVWLWRREKGHYLSNEYN